MFNKRELRNHLLTAAMTAAHFMNESYLPTEAADTMIIHFSR